MTRNEMDAAIREAWDDDPNAAINRFERLAFIAGMRAAADIADNRSGFGPKGTLAVRKTVDDLEKTS